MNWYIDALKKYAVFSGRARRKEFWMFYLFNMIISFVLTSIEVSARITPPGDQFVFGAIFYMAILIPSYAVGVRRMHDTDHSGWWLLFPLVNLYFAASEGTQGENRFGPDPKPLF